MTAWLDQFSSPAGAFLGAMTLLLAAYALGKPLSSCLLLPQRGACGRNAVSISLGLSLWAMIALGLGTLGILSRSVIHCLIVPVALAGTVMIVLRLRSVTFQSLRHHAGILPVCCFGLLLLGSSSVLPLNWDEMVYQVSVPMRWLSDGSTCTYADNPYSGFPSACSLVYALAIAVGGPSAAKILSLAMWLLTVLLLWDFPSEENPLRRTPLWGVLCLAFAVSEPALMAASATYAESFLVLQCAVVLTLMIQEDGEGYRRRGGTLALGIFCGISLAIKLTGGSILLGAVAGMLGSRGKRVETRLLKQVAEVIVIAAIVALPFYLRPWIQTGNPCYPYFAGVFTPSASAATQEMSQYHHALGTEKFGLSGITGAIMTPFLLTIPRLGIHDGSFGLQFLFIGIGILFLWRSRGWQMPVSARTCLVFAMTTYVAWFLSSRQARFLLPSACAVLMGLACFCPKVTAHRESLVACILLSGTIVFIPINILKHSMLCWQHTLGRGEAVNLLYTATGDDYLPVLDAVHQSTPNDARIMLLFEHRRLYIHRDTVIGTPFFQDNLFTPPEAFDADDIQQELTKRQITHVIVGLNANDPDRIPKYLKRCNGFLEQLGVLVEEGFLMEVFRRGNTILYSCRHDT